MKIGILGSRGFIGGHLVDHYLTKGCEVIGLDNGSTGDYINDKATNYHIDLLTATQSNLIEILGECDVIIHLASTARVQPSIENPVPYFQNNLGNLVNVLNALREWKGKFIYVSSSSVYGVLNNYQRHLGASEISNLNPMSPYAVTKKMAEELCFYYMRMFGLDVKIVRPFNVYGDRMSSKSGYQTVLSVFLEQWKNKQNLTVFGDGQQIRDFTHINDFIQAIDLILNTSKPDLIYNIASNLGFSINAIASSFPYYCEIDYLEGKVEPPYTKGNIGLLKKIGYEPKHNVLEWIQQQTT